MAEVQHLEVGAARACDGRAQIGEVLENKIAVGAAKGHGGRAENEGNERSESLDFHEFQRR